MNSINKLLSAYKFDIRAFALFRIAFAFVMLLDLCIRLSDFRAFYTNEGVLPYNVLAQYLHKYLFLPIYQLNDSVWFVGICFIVHIGAVLCFAIGYKTRFFQIVILLFYISLHMRFPYLLQGGDDLIRVMLFFSLFLPLNGIWAVQIKPVKFNYTLPTLAFMFQIVMVYWVSALMKNSSEWHADGTALYYAFSLDSIQWPLAKYLLQFPNLLQLLTPIVFYFELLIPILFFVPYKNNWFRMVAIILVVFFQISIAFTLFVGLFYLINLVALIPLLPSSFFNSLKLKKLNLPESNIPSTINNYILGLVLIYVLLWNSSHIPQLKYGLASKLKSIAFTTGLNQNWGMFAPAVLKDDGWFIYEAITNDGDTIDLNNNGKPVQYIKPLSVLSTVKNDRWRKYSEHFTMQNKAWLCQSLHYYILNEYYKKECNKAIKIKKLNIVYMRKTTPSVGKKEVISKVYLTNY